MRIYDSSSKRVLTEVTLFLTPSEMRELADAADQLAGDAGMHHCHINDSTFAQEITVAVYTADNLSQFDDEARRIIGNDDSEA
jgi:hypothetical protein